MHTSKIEYWSLVEVIKDVYLIFILSQSFVIQLTLPYLLGYIETKVETKEV